MRSPAAAPPVATESPWLTTRAAASYSGLSKSWLEQLRCEGRGPRYRRVGRRVLYHTSDLDAWIESGGE